MKNMKKFKNSILGFTLVELLAVVAIIGVVSSITILISTNIISSSKNKSYQSTINNITNVANSYLMEKGNNTIWYTETNDETTCFKVGNLIETGFFDKDILSSPINNKDYVQEEDYIYVKRDKNNKTLKTTTLLTSEVTIETLCEVEKGNIKINTSPVGWNNIKTLTVDFIVDEIDINFGEYRYTLEYNGEVIESNGIFSNKKENKIFEIRENGEVVAKILHNGEVIKMASLEVSKIDTESPYVNAKVDSEGYQKKHEVSINLADQLSGVKAGTYTIKYEVDKDIECSKMGNKINLINDKSEKILINNITDGTVSLYWCIDDNVFDNANNMLTENKGSLSLMFDNIAPEVSFSPNGGTFNGKIETDITVKDSLSGIGTVMYQWTDSNSQPTDWSSAQTVSITKGEGTRNINIKKDFDVVTTKYLWVKAVDMAGNQKIVASKKFVYNPIYKIEYNLNKGYFSTSQPQNATYGKSFAVNVPKREITLTISKGSFGDATISGGTKLISDLVFDGFNGSNLNLTTAVYSLDNTTYYKFDGKTTSEKMAYFKNLTNKAGTITLNVNWKIQNIKLPEVSLNGYVCGFKDENNNYLASGGVYVPDGSKNEVSLTVSCEANVYKISLYYNDGTEESGTIYEKYNTGWYSDDKAVNSISKVNVPKKANYEFLGYYTSISSGERIIDANGKIEANNKRFTKDETLYAQYKSVEYKITYYNHDGSSTYNLTPNSYTFGTGVTLATPPSVDGYDFAGWCTTKNSDACTTVKSITGSASGDKVYYANWNNKTYGITYSLYNSDYKTDGSYPTVGTVDVNLKISSPKKSVTININKNGWTNVSLNYDSKKVDLTFNGWTATGLDTVNAKYGVTSPTTSWKSGKSLKNDEVYYVNLAVKNGNVVLSDNWEDKIVNLPVVNLPGYVCKFKAPNGTLYDSAEKYTINGNSSGVVTFKVDCTANIYKITLDDNGGSGGKGTIYEKYNTGWYSDSLAKTAISSVKKPTKSGWEFLGYYTSKTAGSKIIDANGTIVGASNKFSSDTTLYAHWSDNSGPSIKITNSATNSNGWSNKNFNLSFSATDNSGSIAYWQYSKNCSGNYTTYTAFNGKSSGTTDAFTTEQNSTFCIKACDPSGNCSEKTTQIKLDKTPPVITPRSASMCNSEYYSLDDGKTVVYEMCTHNCRNSKFISSTATLLDVWKPLLNSDNKSNISTVCLANVSAKDAKGAFTIALDYDKTDNLSGIDSSSRDWELYGNDGKEASGCYSNKNNRNTPCLWLYYYDVYDKAGNKTTYDFWFKVGYYGVDSFCTGASKVIDCPSWSTITLN